MDLEQLSGKARLLYDEDQAKVSCFSPSFVHSWGAPFPYFYSTAFNYCGTKFTVSSGNFFEWSGGVWRV